MGYQDEFGVPWLGFTRAEKLHCLAPTPPPPRIQLQGQGLEKGVAFEVHRALLHPHYLGEKQKPVEMEHLSVSRF